MRSMGGLPFSVLKQRIFIFMRLVTFGENHKEMQRRMHRWVSFEGRMRHLGFQPGGRKCVAVCTHRRPSIGSTEMQEADNKILENAFFTIGLDACQTLSGCPSD